MRNGHFKERYGDLVALSDSRMVWAWSWALIAGLAILPLVATPYTITLATPLLIQVVGVLGLNLLIGNAGLISLGYSAFLAIGAYASVIVSLDLGMPEPFGILFGGIAAAFFGLVIGVPSLRLKGLYLAITTLAFAFIVNHAIVEGGALTRGSQGIRVPPLTFVGLDLSQPRPFYWVCLVFAIGATVSVLNIERTRLGRALMALREYDLAARAMGINLTTYRLTAFVVSSFYIGISGALYAHYVKYLNVDNFSPVIGIEAVAMIIAGGIGSVLGSIAGVVIMTILPELIRIAFAAAGGIFSGLLSTNAIEIRGIVLGLVIILFLRFEPDGFAGVWRETRRVWDQFPYAR